MLPLTGRFTFILCIKNMSLFSFIKKIIANHFPHETTREKSLVLANYITCEKRHQLVVGGKKAFYQIWHIRFSYYLMIINVALKVTSVRVWKKYVYALLFNTPSSTISLFSVFD